MQDDFGVGESDEYGSEYDNSVTELKKRATRKPKRLGSEHSVRSQIS